MQRNRWVFYRSGATPAPPTNILVHPALGGAAVHNPAPVVEGASHAPSIPACCRRRHCRRRRDAGRARARRGREADPARWNLALNHVRNLQDDLGAANVEIEVVAYGPGIGMLKLDAVSNSRVTDAIKAGVQVAACENTMRNQKLVRADMHPNVSYVPAGVVEIIRRQQEGWAYLRP